MAKDGTGINISGDANAPVYDEQHAYTVRVVSEARGYKGAVALEYDLLTDVSDSQLESIYKFLRLLFDKARGPIKNITVFSGGFDKHTGRFGAPVIVLHNQSEKFYCDFQNHECCEAPTDTEPDPPYHFFVDGMGPSCQNRKLSNSFVSNNFTEEEFRGAVKLAEMLNLGAIPDLGAISYIQPLTDKEFGEVMRLLHKN